ncbi:hypothetical protein D3C72_1388650 [compost metagenome]
MLVVTSNVTLPYALIENVGLVAVVCVPPVVSTICSALLVRVTELPLPVPVLVQLDMLPQFEPESKLASVEFEPEPTGA